MIQQVGYISEAYIPKKFGWSEEIVGETKTGPITALVLEGEFQRAEVQNKNRRVYSEALLHRETGRLNTFIAERNSLPMGMDHPLPGEDENAMTLIQRMGMENACALCTHLEMNNQIVYGKARAIEGDHGTGDKLASMVRMNFKPGVSSRGVGSQAAYTPGDSSIYVPEDYTMITYDFVSQPSTFNAILSQKINEEYQILESMYKKEKVDNRKKLWGVMIDLKQKYHNSEGENYGKK